MPDVDETTFQRLCFFMLGTYSLRVFRENFGIDPALCSLVWYILTEDEDYATTFPTGAHPKHLLWALLMLKVYSTESSLCAIAKVKSPKTFRKWAWVFVVAMADLAEHFIVWEMRKDGAPAAGDMAYVSIDGTDCRILEPRPFHKRWYSWKFNGPGLQYEVGVAIRSGSIVWLNGPFPPGEWPDLEIAKAGVLQEIDALEWIIADRGYRKEGLRILTPIGIEQESLIRARHESINRKLKYFNCLKNPFRHGQEKHQQSFYAIAVLTQLSMQNGHAAFDVNYDGSAAAAH